MLQTEGTHPHHSAQADKHEAAQVGMPDNRMVPEPQSIWVSVCGLELMKDQSGRDAEFAV